MSRVSRWMQKSPRGGSMSMAPLGKNVSTNLMLVLVGSGGRSEVAQNQIARNDVNRMKYLTMMSKRPALPAPKGRSLCTCSEDRCSHCQRRGQIVYGRHSRRRGPGERASERNENSASDAAAYAARPHASGAVPHAPPSPPPTPNDPWRAALLLQHAPARTRHVTLWP